MPSGRVVPPRRWRWQRLSQGMSPPKVQPAMGTGCTAPQQHRPRLELKLCQGLGMLQRHQRSLETRVHQELRRNLLHQHHPCLELRAHQEPACNWLHQHHRCWHHPCLELISHRQPVCNTPRRHHPNPEPMSHQRPSCPMVHQHHLAHKHHLHPKPRPHHRPPAQFAISPVTRRQARRLLLPPHSPQARQRAVRGCRQSSSLAPPNHGLALVTLGVGIGVIGPAALLGMEGSAVGKGGDGEHRDLIAYGVVPAAVRGWPQPSGPTGSDWGGPGPGHPLRSALCFFCLSFFFSTEEMLYLPPPQHWGCPGALALALQWMGARGAPGCPRDRPLVPVEGFLGMPTSSPGCQWEDGKCDDRDTAMLGGLNGC